MKVNAILITIILSNFINDSLCQIGNCFTNKGETGRCVTLANCSPITFNGFSVSVKELLQNVCGRSNNSDVKICCTKIKSNKELLTTNFETIDTWTDVIAKKLGLKSEKIETKFSLFSG